MFEAMRKVFGPIMVTVIIGAIALVFVFYGIVSPKNMQREGSHEVAEVNGERILSSDFERQYRARSEYFSKMFGGKMDPRMEGMIRGQVLQEMVGQKLLIQNAKKLEFGVADTEVRDQIMQLPYFKKKDDKGAESFDPALYRELLAQNGKTPAEFEDLIRQDLLAAKPMAFFKSATQVSEQEIQDQFKIEEDRRTVEYVLMDRENIRKQMVVSDKQIKEFLDKPDNLNIAKQQYDMHKSDYIKTPAKKPDPKSKEKPKPPEFYSFEEVKTKVISNYLKDRRIDEMNKLNEALAKEVYEKAKSMSASAFQGFVKSKGLTVKTSDKFNQIAPSGVPSAFSKLVSDAFMPNSPLTKEPQLYHSGVQFLVAFGLKKASSQEKDFAAKRSEIAEKISQSKFQNLFQGWMASLREKAKISISKAVTQEEG